MSLFGLCPTISSNVIKKYRCCVVVSMQIDDNDDEENTIMSHHIQVELVAGLKKENVGLVTIVRLLMHCSSSRIYNL